MRCFLTPKTLKKQTKVLVKNWPQAIGSIEARFILTNLYGYQNPHHYNKVIGLKDGSARTITPDFLLQNLEYFQKRLALLGDVSDTVALNVLKQIWPGYIPVKGYFPHHAMIRFFGNLNDFLFQELRDQPLKYGFNGFPAIKDAIEALGIPHPEVAAVVVNGHTVNLSYQLQPGEAVMVYPFHHPGITPRFQLMPQLPHFLLDVHLGTLAKFLRMAGFDTRYQTNDPGDELLAKFAEREQRILLSRDIGLLKRGNVDFGYWVRNTDPKQQFKEIVLRYGLSNRFDPFTRCITCNGSIEPVDIETVKNHPDTPANITNEFQHFKQCDRCNKIYWKGSHYDNMTRFLEEIKIDATKATAKTEINTQAEQ